MDKQRQHGALADWQGLERLSDKTIVALTSFIFMEYDNMFDRTARDVSRFGNALLRESERRGWSEDWWEDPSIVLGTPPVTPQDATGMEIPAEV